MTSSIEKVFIENVCSGSSVSHLASYPAVKPGPEYLSVSNVTAATLKVET
jgi:hypothetical protein